MNKCTVVYFSIVRRIQEGKERIIEGHLRCDELKEHLKKTNSPNTVFLSEDGSGIVQRIIYDVKTNQLIGLALPFNDVNGIPKSFSFIANSREDIENYMKKSQSKYVYIVAAQPLNQMSPPFILQIFGTTNKFTAIDVLKRWQYTAREMKKYVQFDFFLIQPIRKGSVFIETELKSWEYPQMEIQGY